MFLYLKSLHIIFVVTWFAGLFYIGRLFVYHAESESAPLRDREILQKQFKLMEKRLWYGITWPSAILTAILGTSLLRYYWPVTAHFWLVLKLGFVVALYLYQMKCHFIVKEFQQDRVVRSSNWYRLWNEVPTLLLFAIVFLVILKQALAWATGVAALVLLMLLIFSGFYLYRKMRQSRGEA